MTKRTPFVVMAVLSAIGGAAYAQNPLPRPWQHQDIGAVGVPGSATQADNGDILIAGSGNDIWGTADSFHFLYQFIQDGEISIDSPSLENTNPHAKIGVMMRKDLVPGAVMVVLDQQPDGSVEFMTRQSADGETTFIAGQAPNPNAGWILRLIRRNRTVTGEVCYPNAPVQPNCVTLGTVPFPEDFAFTGAVITSHDNSVLNHGVIPHGGPTVITVPAPWQQVDVGATNIGIPGSAFFQNDTFTVVGAGTDIWGTSDSYHFVKRRALGDSLISARVVQEQAANSFAKAGLVAAAFRGSQTVILDVRPNGAIEFMARALDGGSMAFIAGAPATFPVWLMLERNGDDFIGLMSQDGQQWQPVGSTTVHIAPGSYDIGLAVTSHDPAVTNTSVFDRVFVATQESTNLDIGDVGANGGCCTDVQNQFHQQTGAGADIWGREDAFNFNYQRFLNDGAFEAAVFGLQGPDPFAKAGIMIRESADPSSAHVILDVRPHGEVEFMVRSSGGAETTFIAGATASFPVRLRLTRSGSTITAELTQDFSSNSTWTAVGSVDVDFSPDVLVGTVVTSHQRGVTTWGGFR
jgi:hypothetical protein